MRLGVLLDRLDPARGGAEGHTAALLARAAERGFAPCLATLDGLAPPGATTVRVAPPRGTRAERERAFAVDGVAALRDAGCDRVLAVRHALSCDAYLPHGGLVDDAYRARDDARGGAGFWRRLAHAASAKRRYVEEAERALLGDAEGPVVIALSDALRRRILARYPAARDRIVVIPNGVDAERFEPASFAPGRAETRASLGLPPDALLGALIAHEPWLKGYGTVLGVLASPRIRALAPPLHVVVAGRRAGTDLRRAARRAGVADRVHLVGPVADVRPLLAAADLLVQPSWHDPCSLTTLEALSMGVPVVTTMRNGASELMAMRGGIVVEDPSDVAGVAAAVAILADARLRAETSADARFVAKKSRLVTRLDQVLAACEHRGPPPQPPPVLDDAAPQADPCLEHPA